MGECPNRVSARAAKAPRGIWILAKPQNSLLPSEIFAHKFVAGIRAKPQLANLIRRHNHGKMRNFLLRVVRKLHIKMPFVIYFKRLYAAGGRVVCKFFKFSVVIRIHRPMSLVVATYERVEYRYLLGIIFPKHKRVVEHTERSPLFVKFFQILHFAL